MRSLLLLAAILVLGLIAYWAVDFLNPALDQAERKRLTDAKLAHDFIELPSGITHYRISGPADAPVILMIHGFSTPGFVFDDLIAPLNEAGFRVVTYDQFGRGFSDRPRGDYDADLAVKQASELLAALKIDSPVNVVGYSLGGAIAALFSIAHPEQVRSVCFIAPGGLPLPIPSSWLSWPVVGEVIARFSGHLTTARAALDSAPKAASPGTFASAYLVQLRYRGYAETSLSIVRHFPIADTMSAFREIGARNIPVLALWGEKDHTVPLALWDDLHKAIPNAELATAADTGHEITYAKPQWVADKIASFLAAHGK